MPDEDDRVSAAARFPLPQAFPPALQAHFRNSLAHLLRAQGDADGQIDVVEPHESSISSQQAESEDWQSFTSEEAMTFADPASDDVDAAGNRTFDVALPATHSYLGDTEDLERGCCTLEESHCCSLPLILLEDVVLMPGMTVPLRLNVPTEISWMQSVMQAPEPYTRLLTVVGCKRSAWGWSEWDHSEGNVAGMGCTAELRQIRREEHGSSTCIAVGRQRARLLPRDGRERPSAPDSCQAVRQSWPVRICGQDASGGMQPEARGNAHFWPAWVHQRFCAHALADVASQLFSQIRPKARAFQGSPEELSWWLAANLPMQHATRQELLELPCAAARLRTEIAHMRMQHGLHCSSCRTRVSSVGNVVAMSESGAAGVYLNPHGYVHDMVTLSKTVNVVPHGLPETENSWFPGFAWTLAYCRSCSLHMGWKFTAVCPNKTHPTSFWGLRRTALSETPRPDETRARRATFWQAAG